MSEFSRSVFVNCPFDEDYEPFLQAIAFCIADLGFIPRLAPEDSDNSRNRLTRIAEIVGQSKFGIHDISRCKSAEVDEYARLNMPFELGMDLGAKEFGPGQLNTKAILVLENEKYDYQKALSDISGWDIQHHGFDYIRLTRVVRNWLVAQSGGRGHGAEAIRRNYADFQEWYWLKEGAAGASEADILDYPTVHVVQAMLNWIELGRPLEAERP